MREPHLKLGKKRRWMLVLCSLSLPRPISPVLQPADVHHGRESGTKHRNSQSKKPSDAFLGLEAETRQMSKDERGQESRLERMIVAMRRGKVIAKAQVPCPEAGPMDSRALVSPESPPAVLELSLY